MKPKGGREYWAKITREACLRETAPDRCLDSRMRHVMILWSVCGPDVSEAVVLKDANGWIRRDAAGQPIPAQLKDIGEFLGIPYENRAMLTRIAKAFVEQKILRWDGKVMYLEPTPPAFENRSSVDCTVNWNIAGLTVQSTELPTDPALRTVAVRILEERSTLWKQRLSELKKVNREETVQALLAAGILIDEKQKSLKAKSAAPAAIPSVEEAAIPSVEEPPPPPPRSPLENGTALALAAPPIDGAQVFDALLRYGPADPAAAKRLILECRQRAPGCTTEQVCLAIHAKAEGLNGGVRNAIGLLLDAVPSFFEGDFEATLAQVIARPRTETLDPKTKAQIARMERVNARLKQKYGD
jgi:hypothetical protein